MRTLYGRTQHLAPTLYQSLDHTVEARLTSSGTSGRFLGLRNECANSLANVDILVASEPQPLDFSSSSVDVLSVAS